MINKNSTQIDLAVFDLDGTICEQGRGVFPSAVEALRHIYSKNVPVCIATGRSLSEIPSEIMEAVDPRFVIGINGAMVSDLRTGETPVDHRIPAESGIKLLEIARKYKSGYCVYSGDRDVIDPESLKNWEHWKKFSGGYAWIPEECIDDLMDIAKEGDVLSKVCAFVIGEDPAFTAMKAEALEVPGICVTSAVPCEIEVLPAGVDKGVALSELCERLGIETANVFCMGDGENDAEMLEIAGISVAMGNACDKAKRSAKYLTDDCDKDGVYNAVMRFFT